MKYLVPLFLLIASNHLMASEYLSKLNGKWLCPAKFEQEGIMFKGRSYDIYDIENMTYVFDEITSLYLDEPEPFAQYSAHETGTLKLINDGIEYQVKNVEFTVLKDPQKILTPELLKELEESYKTNNGPIKTISIRNNIWLSLDPESGKSSECYKIKQAT